MKNTYLHQIACLLLIVIAGPTLAQGSAKPDTLFNKPYVDLEEWRDKPVRHYYVHGGFKGTDTRFSFYFPPKAQYQGRFFSTSPQCQTTKTYRRVLPEKVIKLGSQ